MYCSPRSRPWHRPIHHTSLTHSFCYVHFMSQRCGGFPSRTYECQTSNTKRGHLVQLGAALFRISHFTALELHYCARSRPSRPSSSLGFSSCKACPYEARLFISPSVRIRRKRPRETDTCCKESIELEFYRWNKKKTAALEWDIR